MTRYGMAIDLRRCAGCGACVVACQMFNNQKPGVSWVKLDVKEWGDEPGASGRAYLPHACMHCTDAPCVDVCPTGASQKLDDGVVIVDYDACIACGSCITACPYGARCENDADGNYFESEEQAPYEAYGVQRSHVVEKCIFCHDRVEEGLPTACVLNCPAKARYFGDLEDPESDVSKFIAANEVVQVDDTAFYYMPVAGMDESHLPNTGAVASQPEPGKAKSPDAGIPMEAVAAGAAAVAVVGVGAAVGVSKSRKKSAASVENAGEEK